LTSFLKIIRYTTPRDLTDLIRDLRGALDRVAAL